ncbi:MAG: dimethyl sulfoxide reductase anchor subunit [Candidatus Aminicenantes bacterium]|nr:dimethyl sulfoxide reductase anchor subunit [Candidatus Aminicenantes bacterium]
MARREWPLVVFTLLGQTAVGAFGLTAVPLAFSGRSAAGAAEAGGPSLMFVLCAGVAALLAVAAVISFLHLGRPWLAFHAADNIKRSWLSREIFCLIAFLFLAAGLAAWLWLRPESAARPGPLRAAVVAAGLSGLAFLYSMVRVYMLETVPVWRNIHTPASFLVSALLLGSLGSALVLSGLADRTAQGGVPSARYQASVALIAAAAGLAVTIFLTPLAGVFGARAATLRARPGKGIVPLIAVRTLLLAGVGACVLIHGIGANPSAPMKARLFLWTALAGALAAAGVGRWLFYAVYDRIGV